MHKKIALRTIDNKLWNWSSDPFSQNWNSNCDIGCAYMLWYLVFLEYAWSWANCCTFFFSIPGALKNRKKSKNASRLVMRAERELYAPRLHGGLANVHASGRSWPAQSLVQPTVSLPQWRSVHVRLLSTKVMGSIPNSRRCIPVGTEDNNAFVLMISCTLKRAPDSLKST